MISDTLASGAGRIEGLVLPYRYDHLAPLVDLRGSTSRGAEKAPRNPLSNETVRRENLVPGA